MQYKIDAPRLQAIGDWPATREEAAQRLDGFVSRAGHAYARERNYDFGPELRLNVSVLSPYVRHRILTEQEVVETALAQHGPSGAEKFIQEVCWRTYWKGWLERRPATWTRYTADVTRLRAALQKDASLAARVAAAEQGKTGITCFDAWVNELDQTGYLHNHARMWFASIWIFTLRLPWQLGADFFSSRLLDGDAASNTLSWRWVGGLHTTGKTYLARPTNINDFTQGRFPMPRGLAEFAEPLSDPAGAAPAQPLMPRHAAPDSETVLLVGEDDLSPETLPFGKSKVAKVVILRDSGNAKGHGLPYMASVSNFKTAGLTDASERASRHFWCPVVDVDIADANAAAHVIAGLTLSGTTSPRAVMMAETPVGPAKDRQAPLLSELQNLDLAVTKLRRDWDEHFWPHASRGFFNLKEKIPSVLRELGLES